MVSVQVGAIGSPRTVASAKLLPTNGRNTCLALLNRRRDAKRPCGRHTKLIAAAWRKKPAHGSLNSERGRGTIRSYESFGRDAPKIIVVLFFFHVRLGFWNGWLANNRQGRSGLRP